jgi:hypothetical protein
MNTIIFGLTIILLIVSPMIYLFLVSGKNNNDKIRNFKTLCKKHNISLNNTGQWLCSIIGIDNNQGKLCYMITKDQNLQIIELSSVVKCQIMKNYNQLEHKQQGSRNLLNYVSLQLQLDNNSVIEIPLFDVTLSEDPQSTLYDAAAWEKIISKHIRKT